jgi:hypothetical protein
MPSEDPFENCTLFQPLTYCGAKFHACGMTLSTGLFCVSHEFSQFCVIFIVEKLELVCVEVIADLCEYLQLLLHFMLLGEVGQSLAILPPESRYFAV